MKLIENFQWIEVSFLKYVESLLIVFNNFLKLGKVCRPYHNITLLELILVFELKNSAYDTNECKISVEHINLNITTI